MTQTVIPGSIEGPKAVWIPFEAQAKILLGLQKSSQTYVAGKGGGKTELCAAALIARATPGKQLLALGPPWLFERFVQMAHDLGVGLQYEERLRIALMNEALVHFVLPLGFQFDTIVLDEIEPGPILESRLAFNGRMLVTKARES